MHSIYIGTMVLIVIIIAVYLAYTGYSYYVTPLEERFYHDRHDWFKPSGLFGHGLGIIGTLMILFGVSIYIARKRYNFLSRQLRLKYLLEFHIFLCTLGPILILFHTAFKFGGIVSIAFWSMVAVVMSGVIGRFIYIQIPRTIEGRELSLNEVKAMRAEAAGHIKGYPGLNENVAKVIESVMSDLREKRGQGNMFIELLMDRKAFARIKKSLKNEGMKTSERRAVLRSLKQEINLSNKIRRLQTMQKLFKYWHVAHLPFALIMLIIVIIHIAITLVFGYKWIF